MLLLSIFVLLYGSHDNRLYVLKDPPTVSRQWADKQSCLNDPAAHAMPNARCVEVTGAPVCYNQGSACTIDPVNDADRALQQKMVQQPN